MKFLSVAVAGTISTFILGGTALPLSLENSSLLKREPTPFFPDGIPDPIPDNCEPHCPIIGKREPTPEPVAWESELVSLQRSPATSYEVGADSRIKQTRHMGDDGALSGLMKRVLSPLVCARDLLAGRCCGVCPSVAVDPSSGWR